MQFFLDGVLKGETVISSGYVSNCYFPRSFSAAIGRDGSICNGVVPSYQGKVAGFAVFDRALTAAEVLSHATVPTAPTGGQPTKQAQFTALLPLLKKGVVAPFADPVNSATGAFTHEVLDLSRSAKGEAFSLNRLYDSTVAVTTPLGAVWGSPLFESVAPFGLAGSVDQLGIDGGADAARINPLHQATIIKGLANFVR
jgi:Domain of unknown function (DUF6531)